jgi:NlpC/P60 family putative phage cell wall peptidase
MNPDDIISATRAWLGTPYRHQAATRGAGCDCLGLVRGVWRMLYGGEPMALPSYGPDWRDLRHAGELLAIANRLLVPATLPPQPGQVVLFRLNRLKLPKHCAIMTAPDRFIHAEERLGVVEAALTGQWRRRMAGAYAFPERSPTPR